MKTGLAGVLAAALVVTACGAGVDDTTATTLAPSSSRAAPAGTPATTEGTGTSLAASAEVLTSYRFSMQLGLTTVPGSDDVEELRAIMGAATTEPERLRIFGNTFGEAVELVYDGTRWWDTDDPSLELTDEDIDFFLAGNGFLLRRAIDPLLEDAESWTDDGKAEHLGLPITISTRSNVRKDVDWQYGDLAQIEVWRDSLDQVVKFTAWFATGDNTGFPVATWELVERNPSLAIELPASP